MTTWADPKSVDVRLLIAAQNLVDTMVSRCDRIDPGNAPMWYGWAIREAFLAGVQYAKSEENK